MQVDETTLSDLAIFHADEDQSVLNQLNFCQTMGGSQWLHYLLKTPLSTIDEILETQQTIKLIMAYVPTWPAQITNGTLLVIQRYYDAQIDRIPPSPSGVDAFFYKLLHSHDYSLIKYSVGHVIDFIKGLSALMALLEQNNNLPAPLRKIFNHAKVILEAVRMQQIVQSGDKSKLSPSNLLFFGHYLLYHCKDKMHQLIDMYCQIDAYYSLAKATLTYGLQFPEFKQGNQPYLDAKNLFHPLLKTPTSYNLILQPESNFIFLTGANMAGKSTFIKAVGIAVYLAHAGMAVPASAMQLSLFDGLLSNIQVADNIVRGESYFFNEVQRIKTTLTKISDGRKWLVLIDELFKGTNVEDAMRCSTAVIKGLLKIKNSLCILSTHLYEIGPELTPYPNIAFRYFETKVTESQLLFSYQLQEGISNDRLGYLILQREGVVDMIDRL
ncbi:MAG: DNA mismatch repair protein MutS [Chitinophagaceae bacterium]|nr:DNA mismatch repair protein MutS [Chitinophagaceae bacterium]